MRLLRSVLFGAALAASGAQAQEANSPFGGFKHDNSLPIEITADSLEVREADQLAIFRGSVVAGQGDLRMTAAVLEVAYGAAEGGAEGTGDIRAIDATGDVFLTNGAETANGAWAKYDVESGIVTMGGGVTLTQGDNAITGESLRIDLDSGVGRVEAGEGGGRVKSIFQPGSRTTN